MIDLTKILSFNVEKLLNHTVNYVKEHHIQIERMKLELEDDTLTCKEHWDQFISFEQLGYFTAGTWIFLSSLTMLAVVVLMLTIMLNKELRETHPSKLYFFIAFCIFNMSYSCMVYYVGTIKFTCYFAIVDMFKVSANFPRISINALFNKIAHFFTTLLFDENADYPKTEYWTLVTDASAVKTLETANIYTFEFSMLLCIMFNICLCLDSYLVFKNPFYPLRKRMTSYTYLSVIVSCLVLPFQKSMMYTTEIFFRDFLHPFSKTLNHDTFSYDVSDIADPNEKSNYYKFCITTAFLVFYMVIATLGLGIDAVKQVDAERSVSGSHTIKFLARHRTFIKVNIFMWLFYLSCMYFQMEDYINRT